MNITDEILANPVLREVSVLVKGDPEGEKYLELQTAKGLVRYKRTVQLEDFSLVEWFEHSQEEDTDSLVYKTAAKQKLIKIQEDYDNAMDILRIIIDETTSYEDAGRTLSTIRGIAREGLKGR